MGRSSGLQQQDSRWLRARIRTFGIAVDTVLVVLIAEHLRQKILALVLYLFGAFLLKAGRHFCDSRRFPIAELAIPSISEKLLCQCSLNDERTVDAPTGDHDGRRDGQRCPSVSI